MHHNRDGALSTGAGAISPREWLGRVRLMESSGIFGESSGIFAGAISPREWLGRVRLTRLPGSRIEQKRRMHTLTHASASRWQEYVYMYVNMAGCDDEMASRDYR